MRKIIALLFSLIIVVLAVLPVSAKQVEREIEGIKFTLDDDYKVNTKEDLLPSSSVEGLVFVAISSNSKHQLQARCTKTEFSSQLGTFDGLDEDSVAPAGEKLFPNGYETVTLGSTLYLKSAEVTEGGNSVVYVTVKGGKLYTFSYFGDDASKIGEFMASVTLPKEKAKSPVKVFVIIIIALFILLDLVFIIFLIMSFVKDYRRRKMDRDQNIVSQYIKIKRRRY